MVRVHRWRRDRIPAFAVALSRVRGFRCGGNSGYSGGRAGGVSPSTAQRPLSSAARNSAHLAHGRCHPNVGRRRRVADLGRYPADAHRVGHLGRHDCYRRLATSRRPSGPADGPRQVVVVVASGTHGWSRSSPGGGCWSPPGMDPVNRRRGTLPGTPFRPPMAAHPSSSSVAVSPADLARSSAGSAPLKAAAVTPSFPASRQSSVHRLGAPAATVGRATGGRLTHFVGKDSDPCRRTFPRRHALMLAAVGGPIRACEGLRHAAVAVAQLLEGEVGPRPVPSRSTAPAGLSPELPPVRPRRPIRFLPPIAGVSGAAHCWLCATDGGGRNFILPRVAANPCPQVGGVGGDGWPRSG